MTSRVIRGGREAKFPGELQKIVINCDQLSCTKAVDDEEIRAGGGLTAMGWQVTPLDGQLRHYCPEHNR